MIESAINNLLLILTGFSLLVSLLMDLVMLLIIRNDENNRDNQN